jgi:hypothetical protein
MTPDEEGETTSKHVEMRNTFKILVRNSQWKGEETKIKIKVKVKLSLWLIKHHAMKTYWGSGGIAPCILNLGIIWRSVVSFIKNPPLYPRYPFDRRVDGPQIWYGRGGEEKNPIIARTGNSTPLFQRVA